MAVLTNTMLQGTAADTGEDSFQIERSLRFNREDDPALERYIATSGNTKKWTWSGWIKKSDLTNSQTLFSGRVGSGAQVAGSLEIRILSGTQLYISFCESNGTPLQWSAENKTFYRDPSAWQHWVVVLDTGNSEANERCRVYVNGKKVVDWGTRNTLTQNFEYGLNKTGAAHVIGAHYSGNNITEHFNGYFSDVYFIDGLALPPSAFAEIDATTGAYNPKAFARPQINDGTVWSTPAYWSGTEKADAPYDNGFDGDTSNTIAKIDNSGTTGWYNYTFTPPNPIKFVDRVEVHGSLTSVRWSINGGPWTTGSSNGIWDTIATGGGTITTIDIEADNNYPEWRGIRIDGVVLLDGVTDPDTYQQLNDGGKHSDNVSGTIYTGYPLANAFNGNVVHTSPTGRSVPNSDSWLTCTPPTAISMNRLRVWFGYKSTNGNFKINGVQNNTNLASGTNGWIEYTGYTSISSIAWYCGSSGAEQSSVGAIEIDGVLLLDDTPDNSFNLKFNDTTKNRYLGKDTLNGKIADATGGKPILVTTDDYGDVTAGAVDTSDADKSDIILAISGHSAIADVHHTVKGSGSALTLSAGGSGTDPAISTDSSRLYGSSIYFDGVNHMKVPHSSTFQFGQGASGSTSNDFTWEFWMNPSSVSGLRGIVGGRGDGGGNNGALLMMNSASLQFNYPNNDPGLNYEGLKINTWYHVAISRNENKIRLFVNGALIETITGTDTVDLYPSSSHWYIGDSNYGSGTSLGPYKGYIQDFRMYTKAKYTAAFKPPSRNDFEVNNLVVNSSDLDPLPSTMFKIVTWTGDGTNNRQITCGFEPSVVICKRTDHADYGDWTLHDALRPSGLGGVSHRWYLNSGGAEDAASSMQEFNSTGFKVSNEYRVNADGYEYIAYCFKGGTTTTNSAGSISTSMQVNDKKWFSFGTYTGTGSNGQIGHGLDQIPTMIWVKNVSSSDSGVVWQHGFSGTAFWNLDQTDPVGTNNTMWGNSTHNDSQIKIGTHDRTNKSGDKYMWFAWTNVSGYCKAGEFTGNGSAGNTIDTDLVPAFLMIKNRDAYSNSYVFDNVRSTSNWRDKEMAFNTNHASGTTNENKVNFNAAGTWSTNTGDDTNKSGHDIAYLAIADDSGYGLTRGDYHYDSLVDSPTNYGEDSSPPTGGEVRGNYPTFETSVAQPTGGVLSNGNMTVYTDANGEYKAYSTMAIPANTGKWYFEVTLETKGNDHQVHLFRTDYATAGANINFRSGANGDVFGYAIDQTAGTWVRYKNGSSDTNGTHDEEYDWLVRVYDYQSSAKSHINFGQRAFKHTAPAGYKCLCTQNLDDTFSGDALNNPSKYFDTALWTGNGVDGRDIKGLGFQPDLVWIKSRNHAYNHIVHDAVRGANKYLVPDSNSAEGTDDNALDAFLSDGFTVGNDYWVNQADKTYVAWNWDAGTAGAANNDGSTNISSPNQWKNATAGFSMTKYTGNGAARTIGHGLGAKPDFWITKDLDEARTHAWRVWHKDLSGMNYRLELDESDAQSTSSTSWNNTAPTNSVFSLGADDNTNKDGNDYIIYCWTAVPGYSAFGKYDGNSGKPFVYLGFRPKFILLKGTTAGRNWIMVDAERSPYNGDVDPLYANTTDTEQNHNALDFLSNGFKIVDDGYSDYNVDADIIYAAFAEFPFKTTRAR